jgi:hypothetical protein
MNLADREQVHHERNLEEISAKPGEEPTPRFATVLIYLDQTPTDGGHTIFPSAEVPYQTSVHAAELMGAVSKHITTVLSTKHEAAQHVQLINEQRLDFKDDEVNGTLAEMCAQVVKADRDPSGTALYEHFAVKPNPGDALVFWHWHSNLEAEWRNHFHGGCPAVGGTKLAMQVRAPA